LLISNWGQFKRPANAQLGAKLMQYVPTTTTASTLTLAPLTAPTAPTASHTDTSTTVARRPGRHTCAAPQFRRHTPFTPPTTRQSRNWQLKPPSSRPPRHHTTELSGPSSRGLEPGLFPHLCVVGVGRSTLQGVLPVLASLAQNQEAI